MTILYRAVREFYLIMCMVLTGCLIVAQAPDNVDSPFMVTELTSSVMASSRKFSCINEEVVYRCVAQRTNNKTFFTQWTWDGTPIGKIFNSTNRIGHDTCNSPSGELNFLHLTLVSTMNDTCVSLLIVIPSLMQSNQTNTDVQVTCTTFGEGQMPPQHSQEITHTAISSRPEWVGNNVTNVNYECYNIINSTALDVLLKIVWPGITNPDDMDFDFYTVLIKIRDGENDSIINRSTIKTNATSYECIIHIPESINSLTAEVQIDAVNRCKDISNMPLRNDPINIDKGNCKNQSQICTCTGCTVTDGSGKNANYPIILGLTGLLALYCFG